MGRIEGANSPVQATDDNVRARFQARLGSNPKDISERVRSTIASVSFVKCSDDPQGNVSDFVVDIVTELDKNNASSIINEPKACENLIKNLIEKLEPSELQMRIKNEQLFWTGAQRCDIAYFEERAGALAVETHNGERARAQCTSDNKTALRGKKRQLNVHDATETVIHNASNLTESDTAEPKQEWDTKCLNPDCEEFHRLKDCTITSESKKKELLSKYYSDAKKKRKLNKNGPSN